MVDSVEKEQHKFGSMFWCFDVFYSFQVENFHTSLALMYLEFIEKEGTANIIDSSTTFREKFRKHILQSTSVQFSYLLSRLEASSAADLHYEKAIIYGKVRNR